MTEELLPCPFCGGDAHIVEGEESAYVQCMRMKMHRAIWFSGDNDAANEVRQQWNRRASASSLLDRLNQRMDLVVRYDSLMGYWMVGTLLPDRDGLKVVAHHPSIEVAIERALDQP